ncbi:MAG: hypothetical protein V9F04_17880 [Dermatophilaceae bacterium]
MAYRRTPWAIVGAVALAAAVALPSGSALADDRGDKIQGDPPGLGRGPFVSVQVLSFNDYHGHLEATDGPLVARAGPGPESCRWSGIPFGKSGGAAGQGRSEATA